jgi:hypothetical protein
MKSLRRVKKKTDKVCERINFRAHNFVELSDGVKEINPKSNYVYSRDDFLELHFQNGFTT